MQQVNGTQQTRSSLVYRAAKHIPSRFLLVHATAKAARKMHNSGRMANTINDVLKLIDASMDSVIDPNPFGDLLSSDVFGGVII
jgi:hypothetical protein